MREQEGGEDTRSGGREWQEALYGLCCSANIAVLTMLRRRWAGHVVCIRNETS